MSRPPALAAALLAVPLAVGAHAAPTATAEEAAAASVPLVVAGEPVELQLVAERGRLVLDLYDDAGLARTVVPLPEGALVLGGDSASLRTDLGGFPLAVDWQREEGAYALGTGSVVAGPSGVDYRGEAGDRADAVASVGTGCAAQWAALGRAVHLASEDVTSDGDPQALAALLATATCGASTVTEVPPGD